MTRHRVPGRDRTVWSIHRSRVSWARPPFRGHEGPRRCRAWSGSHATDTSDRAETDGPDGRCFATYVERRPPVTLSVRGPRAAHTEWTPGWPGRRPRGWRGPDGPGAPGAARRRGGVREPCHRRRQPVARGVEADPSRRRPRRGRDTAGPAADVARAAQAPGTSSLRGLVVPGPRSMLLRRGSQVPALGTEPPRAAGRRLGRSGRHRPDLGSRPGRARIPTPLARASRGARPPLLPRPDAG